MPRIAAMVCGLLLALGSPGRAEIIDRVLAILPGQIITLSDVEAALELGLVEASPGSERVAGGRTALVDRVLMLNEVRRVVPPDPPPAAVDARVAAMVARLGSREALSRVLAASGMTEAVLRLHAADDLRLSSYIDERFSAASQPTEDEVRLASGRSREAIAAERRQVLVAAWVAELRRRADVTIVE